MAVTIFIKFCGFIDHYKPNNLTLSEFTGKFPVGKKKFSIFCMRCNTDHIIFLA